MRLWPAGQGQALCSADRHGPVRAGAAFPRARGGPGRGHRLLPTAFPASGPARSTCCGTYGRAIHGSERSTGRHPPALTLAVELQQEVATFHRPVLASPHLARVDECAGRARNHDASPFAQPWSHPGLGHRQSPALISALVVIAAPGWQIALVAVAAAVIVDRGKSATPLLRVAPR